MPLADNVRSLFSNFYLDGEAAFMDGAAVDQNPYEPGDDAATAWQAGWLSASYAATVSLTSTPGVRLQEAG